MSVRTIDLRGRKVAIAQAGEGPPLVYFHGFADAHGVAGDLLPFHQRLARHARVIAPAHPGCNGSDELQFDRRRHLPFPRPVRRIGSAALRPGRALRWRLDRRRTGGPPSGAGGAADLDRRLRAVRAGRTDGDIFMHAQPERGTDLSSLRTLLFAEPNGDLAKRWFPDGRGDLDEEMRRYQMLRFGSFVGFKPPYFYHRELRERLYRASMPSLVIWGEHDRMVPPTHGAAYHDELPEATRLEMFDGAGHAVHLEQPDRVADRIVEFHKQHPDDLADSSFEAAAPA